MAKLKRPSAAEDLARFIDASPSPFHAVVELARRLSDSGFTLLEEEAPWTLRAGDRRYVVRQDSSLLAFIVGESAPAEAGFKVVGAHTDSPCLKVKPNPGVARHGYGLLACEMYGGILLSTWMDRDLTLAGRVLMRAGNGLRSELVHFRRPMLRVPNLAIHLQRDVNKEGVRLNPQTHMVPVLGLAGKKEAPDIRELLAGEIGRDGKKKVRSEDILDFDLSLASTEASAIGGLDDEFIFAPRLDNLASCHAGVCALVAQANHPSESTRVLVCFDHEEVGSVSAQGAHSPFLRETLRRICDANGSDSQAFARAVAHSLCVSADMAHGVHPNYSELSDAEHMPLLGGGPVIKSNVNQRYATDSTTAAAFALLCARAEIEPQRFVTRNDIACGSTIGPITASELGIKTVDVGNPMLSMHSIREMASTKDVGSMIRVLQQLYA